MLGFVPGAVPLVYEMVHAVPALTTAPQIVSVAPVISTFDVFAVPLVAVPLTYMLPADIVYIDAVEP